eukprot:gene14357-19257_t
MSALVSSYSKYRSLHWVLKIGNLKDSLKFFESVLGLRVLRHEEFESGCEATCNGPYGGAWSKTMIGFVPENMGFALELTYNYGINSYEFGNDLQYIALHHTTAIERAQAFGYSVINGDTIQGPDNYNYKILPPIAGRGESFVAVGLRVANINKAKDYYMNVLGLKDFSYSELSATTLESSIHPTCLLGFDKSQAMLQLIEVHDGITEVNHALSSGRIAFACESVLPVFEKVTQTNDKVQTPPLTLPTPGKADVVVTILVDRDGYEICFVEDVAFYQLCEPKYDIIDYIYRASKGGDGVPLPTAEKIEHDGVLLTDLNTVEDAQDALLSSSQLYKLLYFGASWCKNCKKITPFVEDYAKDSLSFIKMYAIDIASAEDLALEYDVSNVPRFMMFDKNNSKVGDYVGSNEKELREFFDKYK